MNVKNAIVVLCIFASCGSAYAQYAWRLILPRTAYTVQVNPLDANKLYVGNRDDQFWRSYDGGTGWERILLNEIQNANALSSMVVSSADTNVVLIGGFRFDGIRRSTDGGNRGKRVLTDTLNRRLWFISEAIVEDPSNPRLLYASRGAGAHVIYKSSDVGATWDSIGYIDPSLTTRLCTIAIRPDSTNILFVGSARGSIHRSDDAGRTFRRVPVVGDKLEIFDDSEIPKIVFSPRDPMVGYAVVAFSNPEQIVGNGGLLKTTNGGQSWDRVAFADTSLWSVEVRTSSVGTDDVFIGGFVTSHSFSHLVPGDSIVARSLDGGTTWTRFNDIAWPPNEEGLVSGNVWVLRYNKPSNKLYMATESGLYVFDEPTGVEGDVRAHASLHSTITDGVLRVVDTDAAFANGAANAWALFNVQGVAVATGRVESSNELALNLSGFASGAYVMTWGTELKFRTISFVISR